MAGGEMVPGRDARRLLLVAACVLFACVLGGLFQATRALSAPGDYLGSFGVDGTEFTGFGDPTSLGLDQSSNSIYVGDSDSQTVYKFDGSGNPLDWGGSASNISGPELAGLEFRTANPTENQIAVDSETHVVYVTSGDAVRAFEADGEPHEFTAGPGQGSSEIPGATRLNGVAVDRDGNIYASDFGSFSDPSTKRIRIYSSSGELISQFAPKRAATQGVLDPGNLAIAPDGTLYLTSGSVFRFSPSHFPISSATTYSDGVPLDEEPSLSVAVDPTTSYVYISGFQNPGARPRVSIYDERGAFLRTLGAEGQSGELKGIPRGVALNGGLERVYVEVKGDSGHLSQVSEFESIPIPVLPPTITGTSATAITPTSASLRANLNPNTLETIYWFEFGLEDCAAAPGSCTRVPAAGASAGSGHNPVAISVALADLSPNTAYFYRVVAENAEGVAEGAVRTFVTQSTMFGSSLVDGRVWEQVTPVKKFSGVPTNAVLLQADPVGGGIAFHTRGSIVEDPESNRALEVSPVLARRGDGGVWSVDDLVPKHSEAGGVGFGPEFKLFSTDLSHAVFEARDDTPLSVESSERTPYLRTNSTPPSYRPLVTSKEGFANVPPGTVFGGEANGERNPVSISAANSTLTHVVLSSKTPLAAGAAVRSIYLWTDGSLEPVSELPEDEGGSIVEAQPGSGTLTVLNAVSADGSRIFWGPTDPVGPSLNRPALYLRDAEDEVTTRLDVPQSGASQAGTPAPAFMGASADGSVVFFTDSQQLTEDASPEGRDLYRCEIGDVGGSLGCVELEDLSAPLEGSGESAHAEELAPGMSEDGSSVFFVAKAVLDSEPNQFGDTATPDSPNLYQWEEGGGVRFIATLSPGDSTDWGKGATSPVARASRRSATSSPSGRYLTFMSERNLAGDESDDPATGEPVEQVFLYDAAEETLACVSCNANGGTNPGHQIPKEGEDGVIYADPQRLWGGRWVGATTPEPAEGEPTVGFVLYQPRAVLDNGRTFFNSVSPLVTGDSNGTWDVYQYEPFDVGSCDPGAASGTIAVAEEGCVGLISSGTDERPSVFMDASETGDDLFFATFAKLSALDSDEIVDVYDARVGGVAATRPEPPSECLGEACQPGAVPPLDATPNSAGFNGPGNLKTKPAKHCRKGQKKVHRKGKVKCVAKKKKGKGGKSGGGKR